MTVPTTTLPNGDELPAVGFGTWRLDGDELREALAAALEAGYTHVDTAEGYENEAVIGDVIAEYDREELFLTSKVLPKNLDYESVIRSCEASLERLGTDYLDLYLIHWPNPAISLRETMHAMGRLREEGFVRNVGVSNFTAYQLSCAHHVSDVPIAVNQIEFHPWYQRSDLLEYCRETDTVVEAAAPLGRTDVFADEAVREIAERRGKSPAQVVLKWAVERGVVPLPRSSNPGRVRENFELFDWELADEELDRLDDRDRDHAVYDRFVKNWDDEVWGIAE